MHIVIKFAGWFPNTIKYIHKLDYYLILKRINLFYEFIYLNK
jgi:hypothetical protein